MKLSIILCSHNSRDDFLRATLESLRRQELGDVRAELILVDNASDPPPDPSLLEGLPFETVLMREPQLGLTHARMRGIRAARAPLLLLVDDDNLLDPDYIRRLLARFSRHADLGCAGGSIVPRFETSPPRKWESLADCLALRELEEERWSERFHGASYLPYGAGMGLRREVAEHYLRAVERDPVRRRLDRHGSTVISAGDLDLACCAYDLGYRCGLFPELRLKHLIPSRRVAPAYLKELAINIAASSHILLRLRGELPHPFFSLCWETLKTVFRGRNLRRRLLFLRGSWRACLLGR